MISYDIPFLLLAIFVFLLTTFYLERNEFCSLGIRRMVGDTPLTIIGYLLVMAVIVFVVKLYLL
jgi:hypothetical protein